MGSIVSEQYQYVVGVDTHAATHTFAVLAAPSGAVVDQDTFPTTAPGLGRALSWIDRRVGQASALVVVEGTGSYGAILTERLELGGHRVVEAAVMPAGDRRGVGKSDALDAARIARGVLGLSDDELRTPRTLSGGEDASSGARVALRVLVVARDQMTGERTRAINTLTALLRTVDLGVDARKPLTAAQLTTVAGWRDREETLARRTCRAEAVRLARRIKVLGADLATNKRGISDLITDIAPELLDLPGIGPVVAAAVLIAWSHPGRVRSEAAMASLAGTCPIPASSGNTVRYRLNRGGDRRLNRALTTTVIVRMRIDPATRAYVARRRAEGRTTKEIMRSLKRYLTRKLYRTLAAAHPLAAT
jgi:transposase